MSITSLCWRDLYQAPDLTPQMRAIGDWERIFLLRAWDRLYKQRLWRDERTDLVQHILWCFPEVRASSRETFFRSPKGKRERVAADFEVRNGVDQVIERLADDRILGYERCFKLGLRFSRRPLIFEPEYYTTPMMSGLLEC